MVNEVGFDTGNAAEDAFRQQQARQQKPPTEATSEESAVADLVNASKSVVDKARTLGPGVLDTLMSPYPRARAVGTGTEALGRTVAVNNAWVAFDPKNPETQLNFLQAVKSAIKDKPPAEQESDLIALTGNATAAKLLAHLRYGSEESEQANFRDAAQRIMGLKGQDFASPEVKAQFMQIAKAALTGDALSLDKQSKVLADVLTEAIPDPLQRQALAGVVAYASDSKSVASMVNVAARILDAQPEQMEALFNGKQAETLQQLGISQEQFDRAKETSLQGALGYLQEQAGLNQSEVDTLKKLYHLSETLKGADGKIDANDVMSLSASLTANDIDTLKKATGLVGDTLMAGVWKEAHERAHGIKNAHPDYQKAVRYSNYRGLFGGIIRGIARDGIAEGNARANAGAMCATQQIRNNLGDDFPELGKAMAAIEVRDKLLEGAEFQSGSHTATAQEQTDAMKFYEGLKGKSLADLTQVNPQSGSTLLAEAEKHFMNLSRQALEDGVRASLASSSRSGPARGDIVGPVKDVVEQLNRVLSLKANQDLRHGVTQESLELARNAGARTETIINKVLASADVTRGADGLHYKLGFEQALGIMDRVAKGELAASEVASEMQQVAVASGERFFLTKNSNSGLTESTVAEFAKLGLIGDEHLRSKANQQNFAAYQVNGKTYLGYKAQDASGKEVMAYIDKHGQGPKYRFMDSAHQAAYQATLTGGAQAPLRLDLADLQQENYTHKLARSYLPKEADQQRVENFVSANNAAAFRINGKDYLGYLTADGRPAYSNSEGKTFYINDEATKSAYYGALLREGSASKASERTTAFNTVAPRSSADLQYIAHNVGTYGNSSQAGAYQYHYPQAGRQQVSSRSTDMQRREYMSRTGKPRPW